MEAIWFIAAGIALVLIGVFLTVNPTTKTEPTQETPTSTPTPIPEPTIQLQTTPSELLTTIEQENETAEPIVIP